jgi:hypothetical protein
MTSETLVPGTDAKSEYAYTRLCISVGEEEREETIPAYLVADATRTDLYYQLNRRYELPPDLVITLISPYQDELCVADHHKPANFAVELLTTDEKPGYFLKVTKGAQRPNLMTRIPVVRGDGKQTLLYHHSFLGNDALKIDKGRKWGLDTLLHPVYNFHRLDPNKATTAGAPVFELCNCFGGRVAIHSQKRRDLIYNLFHRRFYILCNDKPLSVSISSRCRALHGFVAEETKYRAFLKNLPDRVFPEFEKRMDIFKHTKKFSDGKHPFVLIRDVIPRIATVHVEHIGPALQGAGDYFSVIGDKLAEHMRLFFLYDDIYSAYHALTTALKLLPAKAQRRMTKLDEQFRLQPFAAGLSLMGVVSWLFQRPLQVRTTLHGILDHTPAYHADYRGLHAAASKIDETIAKLDESQASQRDFLPVEFRRYLADIGRFDPYLDHFPVHVNGVPHDLVVLRGVVALLGPASGPESRPVTRFPLLGSTVERRPPASVRLAHGGVTLVAACASGDACKKALAAVQRAHAEMAGTRSRCCGAARPRASSSPRCRGTRCSRRRARSGSTAASTGPGSCRTASCASRSPSRRSTAAAAPAPALRGRAGPRRRHALHLRRNARHVRGARRPVGTHPRGPVVAARQAKGGAPARAHRGGARRLLR